MRRNVRGSIIVFLSIGSFGVAAFAACHDATEVRLRVTTDVPCRPDQRPRAPLTEIYVGPIAPPADPVAETRDCATDRPDSVVGTITLVPSANRDGRFTVAVVMNTDGAGTAVCRKADNASVGRIDRACIVARRTVSFLEHSSREISIRLSEKCRGRYCKDDETCDDGTGRCKKADPDDPSPVDGGPLDDAFPAEASGEASLDAQIVDAGPLCLLGSDPILRTGVGVTELIAVSSSAIYTVKVDGGGLPTTVLRVAKDGKADAEFGPVAQIRALAASEQFLFVGTVDGVHRIDARLSSPTSVHVPGDIVDAVAVDGDDLYYTSHVGAGPSELKRLPAAAMTSTLMLDTNDKPFPGSSLVTTTTNRLVMLKDQLLYDFTPLPYVGDTPIARIVFGVRSVTSFTPPGGNAAIYYVRDTSDGGADSGSPSGLDITRAVFSSSFTTARHVTDSPDPAALATDGTFVYHRAHATDGTYSVRRAPFGANGGLESTAFTGPFYQLGAIAVDAQCVYFAAKPTASVVPTGSLYALPK